MGLLQIQGMSKFFGGLAAVSELELSIQEGQLFGLIGPNGAGKSTVLNLIDGTLRPQKGEIWFARRRVDRLSAFRRARLGIARVFQDNKIFPSFTVYDTIKAASHSSVDGITTAFSGARKTRTEDVTRKNVMKILEYTRLSEHIDQYAINLPHGTLRVLCFAIALATNPKLILLDEPLTGLNADEVSMMIDLVRVARDQNGVTFILIEHNLQAVMGVCDTIAVLDFGRKIAEGTPDVIAAHPDVITAYLGKKDDAAQS